VGYRFYPHPRLPVLGGGFQGFWCLVSFTPFCLCLLGHVGVVFPGQLEGLEVLFFLPFCFFCSFVVYVFLFFSPGGLFGFHVFPPFSFFLVFWVFVFNISLLLQGFLFSYSPLFLLPYTKLFHFSWKVIMSPPPPHLYFFPPFVSLPPLWFSLYARQILSRYDSPLRHFNVHAPD